MARTIFATFDSVFSASKAVHDLNENGFAQNKLDILTRAVADETDPAEWEAAAKARSIQPEIRVTGSTAGINIGIGIGAAVGIAAGLLAWMGEISMPAVLVPGPMANLAVAMSTAIASMLAGGIAGGALGDLFKLGIPEEEMRQYACNVRAEKIVVAILADWDSVDPMIQLLTRHSPLSIEEKPYDRLKSAWLKKSGQARGVQVSPREGEDHR